MYLLIKYHRPVFVCRAGQTTSELDRLNINCKMARSESLGNNGKAFRNALFGFMKEECLDFMRRRKQAFSPAMNTGTSISGLMNSFSKDADCDGSEWNDDDYVGTDGKTPLPFPCHIMTSTMPRARQTVDWEKYPYPVEMLSNLNPLDKGDFMGMELEEIEEKEPEWYEHLVEDPFLTRFPGGECYGDLTSRLESIVVDMEQQVGPVLVVSHVSVLQALVSYFRNSKIEECTSIEM
jgi:phosphohistidine phosphatase SixA